MYQLLRSTVVARPEAARSSSVALCSGARTSADVVACGALV
ncbi:Uncharacterised protein [Mycobacteroides abscessus]|nr:Uncharacterised protein [Mycobacteroides abscessus]